MIRVRCPKCGKLLGLDDSAGGAMGQCPACEETFRIPPAGTDESKSAPAPRRPAPAGPTVLEPADGDDEEISDAQAAEEAGEWGRDAPRERKKRRRRRRGRRDLRTPVYMQDDDDDPAGVMGSLFTVRKILGIILMIWGVLNCFGGVVAAGKAPDPGAMGPIMCGGLICGGLMLIAGAILFLRE
jgi:hypothetical protein